MDKSKFWNAIQRADDTSNGDMDEKCKAIRSGIAILSASEAIGFKHLFDQMMDRSYCWPLWAAAHIIYGFCSDDSFTDFRASLISRGQLVFERAIADPESLADYEDYDEESWFYEGYEYAIADGVEAAAGEFPARLAPFPTQPSGARWEEENVHGLFPKLADRFIEVSSFNRRFAFNYLWQSSRGLRRR